MTGTKAIIIALGAILVIGGIYYWTANRAPKTEIPPANTTTPTTPPNPSPEARESGAPIVSTKGETSVSRSTAILNGEVNPNGGQTSYWYEYGSANSLGTVSLRQLIGGGYLTYAAPRQISGLQANTTYYYRIGAENQYGKVYGEILSFQTSNTPPLTYLPPTAETTAASNIEQRSATLSGRTNPNGATTYYWFEYGPTTALGQATSAGAAGSGSNTITVTAPVTGLNPNTIYYYRFNAQNGYGTANGNILSFITDPVNPPPPSEGEAPDSTTLEARNVGRTTATLRGEVNPNGSSTTYYFEYGKSTIFGLFILDKRTEDKSAGSGTRLSSASATLSGLDPDSTYYYRIVAVNQYGTDWGAILNFTTNKP